MEILQILTKVEKSSNKTHDGKAYKYKPQWKTLQITSALENRLKLKIVMERPSNINRSGKAFKTENRDEKSFLYKLRWKSLQILTAVEKPSN